MGPGTLTVCAFTSLPKHLASLRAAPAPAAGDPATSITAVAALLGSFPGPLSASSPRDTVAKWLKERSERVAEEEGPLLGAAGQAPGVVASLRSLWQLLALMAKNQGHLRRQGASSGSG